MDKAAFKQWAKEWETTLASPDFRWDGLFDEIDETPPVSDILADAAALPPGAAAVNLLGVIDTSLVTADEALQLAALWERQSRWLSTQQQDAAVRFAGVERPKATEEGTRAENANLLELALTVDCGVDLTRTKLRQARLFATTLTATQARVAAGSLSEYRARRIVEELDGLDPDTARTIEASLLPIAADISVPDLVRKLRRDVTKAQGPQALDDHLAGVDERRVVIDREPREAGLLGFHAYLPPELTVAMLQVIERKAAEFAVADRQARNEAEEAQREDIPRVRAKDQRMADALAWYVLGPDADDDSRPARPQVKVQVTIDLPTLMHLRDNPGELGGYGPIPADVARELAQDASWQRFVYEPVTGYLQDQGDEEYVARGRLASFTEARDVRCRFPRSTRSAKHSDNDHIEPFRHGGGGGRTSAANLARNSRLAHVARTHGGWEVSGDANGELEWRSPHGQTFSSKPYDYRPDPGPPPF